MRRPTWRVCVSIILGGVVFGRDGCSHEFGVRLEGKAMGRALTVDWF